MQLIVLYTVGYKHCHCIKYLRKTNSGSNHVCIIVTMTNNSDNNGPFLLKTLQLPICLKYGVLTREYRHSAKVLCLQLDGHVCP